MDMDFSMFQEQANATADEKNVAARFYDKAVKTEELNDSGLPVFKNVTYVEIRLKDNSTEVFNQPAGADKIRRFPREYAMYERAKKHINDGTPLEQFAFLTAAEIATCKNRGVFSVEQLAALDFEKVQSLGLQNEHIQAQMFMEHAAENRKIVLFAQKEQAYEKQIKDLQEKIKELSERVVRQEALLQQKNNKRRK